MKLTTILGVLSYTIIPSPEKIISQIYSEKKHVPTTILWEKACFDQLFFDSYPTNNYTILLVSGASPRTPNMKGDVHLLSYSNSTSRYQKEGKCSKLWKTITLYDYTRAWSFYSMTEGGNLLKLGCVTHHAYELVRRNLGKYLPYIMWYF